MAPALKNPASIKVIAPNPLVCRTRPSGPHQKRTSNDDKNIQRTAGVLTGYCSRLLCYKCLECSLSLPASSDLKWNKYPGTPKAQIESSIAIPFVWVHLKNAGLCKEFASGLQLDIGQHIYAWIICCRPGRSDSGGVRTVKPFWNSRKTGSEAI